MQYLLLHPRILHMAKVQVPIILHPLWFLWVLYNYVTYAYRPYNELKIKDPLTLSKLSKN